MIIGGDKDSSIDKKLPLPPVDQVADQPPPYVFPTDAGERTFASTSSPISTPPPTAMPEPVAPSPPFLTPPANFVSIVETHNAVQGSWTVDTTLPAPPSFIPPVSPAAPLNPGFFQRITSFFPETPDRYVGPTPNLKLKSTHGRVDANVRIVHGGADLKPARLDVRSKHGSIRLAIVSRGKQRINAVAVSAHGSIEVLIPRDFVGLVRHRTKHGRFMPSDEVMACSTTFSLEHGEGQTFIGDWRSLSFSGTSDADTKGQDGAVVVAAINNMTADEAGGVLTTGPDDWPADLLTVDSTHSKLKVSFIDEQ